jgi:flavin reductase (DIM6/NTAB) family NADH-FMN oxidoreductase RutF
MAFIETELDTLKLTPFYNISKDWMLITAGSRDNFNTMTASWGGMGHLWNKNVTFAFVRPQRYTFEFMEKYEFYTLSFFGGKCRDALNYCGKFSGRQADKIKKTGLTPLYEHEWIYFKQSKLIFMCKKLYSDFINPKCFIDKSPEKNYPQKDYHKMYIGEILNCYSGDTDE